jgi:alpha-galactosidase
MFDIMNTVIASFRYDGKIFLLSPASMEKRENDYYTIIDGTLEVSVEMRQKIPCSAEWVVRFRNISSKNTGRISDINGLDLMLPCSDNENAVWYGLEGDYCDGRSFMPIEKVLVSGESHRIQPQRGRPSQETAFPFFDIACGEFYTACALGWCGQWHLDIERSASGVTMKAGQTDCDFYLLSGETARSVRVLLLFGDNHQKLRHDFRRLLRDHYSPACYLGKNFDVPLSVQDFDRYFWNTPFYRTEAGQIKLIENAAKCGGNINTFWLDAAWFREGFPTGVGNYSFAPGFSDGLRRISETAHAGNMKFMVWFEPERIHIGSDIYAEHGDGDGWLLNYGDNNENRLYNLGNPDALSWLSDKLINFIAENGIDIYREDFNIDPLPYWQANDTEERRGICEMRFVEGLYKLWDKIIEHFPGIMIDNCSSGGRRIELETCMRAVPCWRSDTACSPDTDTRPVATWHQNQTANLSRYLPYHLSSSWYEKAYHFRSGMTMGIACGFDFLSDDYDPETAIKATGELVRLRKYWQGDFYALTEPSCDENVWFAYQLNLDGSGFAAVFRRRLSEESKKIIALCALDADSCYRVNVIDENYTSVESVYKGIQLTDGIEITIPDKPSSVIIEYIKI